MKKKSTKIFAAITILLLIIVLLTFFISSFFYLYELEQSKKDIPKCYFQDTTIYSINETFNPGNNGCYEKMLKLLYPKILVHKVKYKNEQLDVINIGILFFLDELAFKNSDAVFSYGIGPNQDDNTFELQIAKKTKKPIYAFDCGLTAKEIKEYNQISNNLHYFDECIGSDNYLMYNKKSSGKIHTLGQKLKELNLTNKKVYLKLGIPEPHLYVDDILKYKDNITGISVVIDFWSPKYIIDSTNFLRKLEKDFVLVSTYYFCIYDISFYKNFLIPSASITLINKNLIEKDSIYWNQKNNPGLKIKSDYVSPINGFKEFQIIFFEKINKYIKVLINKLKH